VIDVDPAIPSVMNTDVVKLKKILKHLIDNGLKYTKEGGVYVHITSVPREYGINLCVEVTDTGIGMNEKEMELVFERFYQADSGRTRATSGLGLGLSIVNGFVSSLKGFLTLESTPDKGTTVRVSIPQEVVDSQKCMSVRSPEKLVLGGFFHFDKFENPHVRVFYNAMVKNIVTGLNVRMHRVDNLSGLKSLVKGMQFTHLFIGKEEYEEDPGFIEELAQHTLVALVAEENYELPEDTHVRLMRKPFYCFPVISFLESNVKEIKQSEERIYLNNVKALVVDDEPMNLMVAKGIFSRYGMIVSTAASGWDAIELCGKEEFDIVFMDHMMPGMDGIEAMKHLRKDFNRAHKDIPIVELTANAVSTAKEMFLREGFDGFVSKPIELSELEHVLKKVLPRTMFAENTYTIKKRDSRKEEKKRKKGKGKKQSFFQALQKLGVDTETGLKYCQNDKEFYQSLLLQFGKDAAGKIEYARNYLERNDHENYAIIVHALKSTSRMIGAISLSEKAKHLENAAKERDTDAIKSLHEDAMKEYFEISDTILKYLLEKQHVQGREGVESEQLFSVTDQEEILEFEPEDMVKNNGHEKKDDQEIIEFAPWNEKTESDPGSGLEEIFEFEPEGGEGE
jgi:CheY-like chemotaxis protein